MASLTLTFPPGTYADVSKVKGSWYVDSVNTTEVIIVVDDIDGDGTLSNDEWDAAVGGEGNDIGGTFYVYRGGGTSGAMYSTNGTTVFTVGQDVTSIRASLSNNFETNVDGVICFLNGTRIGTPGGSTCVENLMVGSIVQTLVHGPKEITWIGKRTFHGFETRENPKLHPVRISAGALGHGLPKRDLLVSRQHRILVSSKIAMRMFGHSEVLVPAIKLTALPDIFVDETVANGTYFHLLFSEHEVIFAEGAPAESLFTGPNALAALSKDEKEELVALFPELVVSGEGREPAFPLQQHRRLNKLVERHASNDKPLLSQDFTLNL